MARATLGVDISSSLETQLPTRMPSRVLNLSRKVRSAKHRVVVIGPASSIGTGRYCSARGRCAGAAPAPVIAKAQHTIS